MYKMAFLNLLRRKSRTFLALLGIMIGVAALLVLVGLVEALNHVAIDAVEGMQGVYILQDGASDDIFSVLDESMQPKLEALPGVKTVTSHIVGVIQTVDGKKVGFAKGGMPMSVIGVEPDKISDSLLNMSFSKLESGRMLRANDKGVVMITTKISEDLNKRVNSSIKLNGEKFKVIGVVDVTSDIYSGMLAMPLEDARDLFEFEEGTITSFLVVPSDLSNVDRLDKLIDFKYPDELDSYSTQETTEMVGGLLSNLEAMTLVIALISSLVAGIGVMNTMLMSVMERYQEIGVLKAVGWTNNNILSMILLESAFLGALGGIIGILFGYAIGELIGVVSGLYPFISLTLLASVFTFAVSVSVFAGIYPAYKASKLEPIDALRSGV